ncbi:MAG: 5'-nucleotidase C-terminal domain-containing protein [Bacteroidales bacterium]|nr:5'-nucleotidase C-terminal domain-containing protein [Bacteroidales bacterium]
MKNNNIVIRLIQTTDVHGAIFPDDLLSGEKREGSLARVYSYVQTQRANDSLEVVLLDNGDLLQGDPVVYYYNFMNRDSVHLLARVMNYMEYDAASVGNHDIEAGHEVYDAFRENLHFDWLAANAVDESTGKPYFKPYTILDRQGIKIAVLGLITPSIPNWLPPSTYSGMHFDDMIESAKFWVNEIRQKENPDAIVGLFHSGLNASYGGGNPNEKFNENASMLVAEQVPGLDVVFAGHDHRVANLRVKNIEGDTVVVINPGAYAMNVGQVDLSFRWNSKLSNYELEKSGSIVSMTNLKPDSTFLYLFNLDLEAVRKYVKQPIGRLLRKIDASQSLFGSSAAVDIVHTGQLELSNADLSLASPFYMDYQLDTGMLFMKDMFRLYRFENYLYVLEMSGLEFKNALEYSYDKWIKTMKSADDIMFQLAEDESGVLKLNDRGKYFLKNPFYNFDSGGGLIYTVDLTENFGSRIKIISLSNGKPFDLSGKYKVAMNSYRANGGGNILTDGAGIQKKDLSKRILTTAPHDFRLMLSDWIISKRKIDGKPTNNWKFIPENFAEKGKLNYLLVRY